MNVRYRILQHKLNNNIPLLPFDIESVKKLAKINANFALQRENKRNKNRKRNRVARAKRKYNRNH